MRDEHLIEISQITIFPLDRNTGWIWIQNIIAFDLKNIICDYYLSRIFKDYFHLDFDNKVVIIFMIHENRFNYT